MRETTIEIRKRKMRTNSRNTMKQIIIILLVLAAAGTAFAGQPAAASIPVVAGPAPAIDGTIGDKEYAAAFTDPRTGITVSWQADSAVLYCALRSPGAGWLAIGFGTDGMSGSDMVIASAGSAGKWIVEEQLGKSFFRHAPVDRPRLIAGAAGLAGGRTVMEFALPLSLSNGKAVSADAALPFILAYHKDKTSFSKHTKRSSGMMILDRGGKQKQQ
jgi:hypothetical protein